MRVSGRLVALDVGGTNIRAAVVDGSDVGPVTQRATPAAEGSAAVVAAMVDAVREVLVQGPADGVAVATAGVVDPEKGRITSATDLIRGWAGTALADDLRAALGLPVRVVNDVVGHGLGEWSAGAGRGASSLLLVAPGTGLGGAFIDAGRAVTGAHGAGGHLGHIPCAEAAGMRCSCGAQGHVECVASGSGLETLYATRAPRLSAREICARTDDDWARTCVETSGRALGRAIGGLLNTLDPELVVLSGGLTHAGDLWWSALRDGVAGDALALVRETPIVVAERPDHAALLGAAYAFTEWSQKEES